jgi:hypothetical protein
MRRCISYFDPVDTPVSTVLLSFSVISIDDGWMEWGRCTLSKDGRSLNPFNARMYSSCCCSSVSFNSSTGWLWE